MREFILSLDAEAFGQYFDHTLLKAFASAADYEAFCREGIRYRVKMLAVNPAAVAFCRGQVKDSGVRVGAAAGFPLGQSTVGTKVFEAIEAIGAGAAEIDYVLNITELKNGNYGYIEDEMKAVVSACRERNAVSKVIFETCYLTDGEKKTLCEMAGRVKPDFIKTSTGFGTGGATPEDVRLMRACTDPCVKVKASGGVKTLDDAAALIGAGAERIGTSHTAAIMGEFFRLRGQSQPGGDVPRGAGEDSHALSY
ncbi:MAG: deoxyribose-phosphate aldolase [Oscillospiraceae bacterium]|nr:deoxyribose-phosphate aldolase [Oscillospiraceae bacterium]